MPVSHYSDALNAKIEETKECLERLADIWPVDDRPKITDGMVFADIPFEKWNPTTGEQHEAATDQPKKPQGIEYPSKEAENLVDKLMILGMPITSSSFKAIVRSIPNKYREDIFRMYEFTLLKSILQFDPARGYQFSTKHRANLKATRHNAHHWVKRPATPNRQ